MVLGRDRVLRQVVRESFTVTQKNGPMFTGVLLDFDERSFRFTSVVVRDADTGVERPAAGELFVDRAQVAYMQRVAKVAKE